MANYFHVVVSHTLGHAARMPQHISNKQVGICVPNSAGVPVLPCVQDLMRTIILCPEEQQAVCEWRGVHFHLRAECPLGEESILATILRRPLLVEVQECTETAELCIMAIHMLLVPATSGGAVNSDHGLLAKIHAGKASSNCWKHGISASLQGTHEGISCRCVESTNAWRASIAIAAVGYIVIKHGPLVRPIITIHKVCLILCQMACAFLSARFHLT
mmetsp:Transcript_96442/g.170508  ORF Transcript_96442/g.170508 Transcript_96442/m.170508 type:complete len:217 (-) Transcript_96442:315-965(-)